MILPRLRRVDSRVVYATAALRGVRDPCRHGHRAPPHPHLDTVLHLLTQAAARTFAPILLAAAATIPETPHPVEGMAPRRW